MVEQLAVNQLTEVRFLSSPLWDRVMVTHLAHNQKTVIACEGSNPSPATKHNLLVTYNNIVIRTFIRDVEEWYTHRTVNSAFCWFDSSRHKNK